MAQAFFGDIRSQLVDRIDVAKDSLKIAMAWFTNQVLFQLILDKAAGGTKIQIIISDSEANFRQDTGLDFDALQRKGVKISVTSSGSDYHFMHHKFVVIDEKILITGSYNWSNNAHTNFENILVIEDTTLARTYSLQFDHLFKLPVTRPLNEFRQLNNLIPIDLAQAADAKILELAHEFNQAVNNALTEALYVDKSLRMDIIENMISRYTAVGAAKKLSNDDEQSGFIKLITNNRPDLTFEYLTAKSRFAKLFDKVTIKNAKEKLRPYIGKEVDSL